MDEPNSKTTLDETACSVRPPRRRFLESVSGGAMVVGVGGAYGTFAGLLGKFVYPARTRNRSWLFVCTVDALQPGSAMDFTSPAGAKIVVARSGPGVTADDFLALSSVCPHLGCQVHWEAQNDRFFCPCHNGAFDRGGNPVAGPPKAANQALIRFPLKVENELLFLEAPVAAVASSAADVDETAPQFADRTPAARRNEGVA